MKLVSINAIYLVNKVSDPSFEHVYANKIAILERG